MNNRYDAVIIGGGPAGAAAASGLAQLGWRVALLERGPRGRDKVCGCCLNPRAELELGRLGLGDTLRRCAVGRTDSFVLCGAPHRPVRFALPRSPGPGWIVPRTVFDQALRDEAGHIGATVLQPARGVARFERQSESWTVDAQMPGRRQVLRTRFLIGADGLRSRVAHAAGFANRGGIGRKFGFSFRLERSAAARRFEHGSITMFLADEGYLGAVRQGKDLHIAALVQSPRRTPRSPSAICALFAARFESLAAAGLDRLADRPTVTVSAIGPMPCSVREVASAHAALIGDAAGYVEPFTGEGMAWAVTSAKALVDAASKGSPGSWSTQQAQMYRALWQRRIRRGHRLCQVIAATLERPVLCKMLLGVPAITSGVGRGLLRRMVRT